MKKTMILAGLITLSLAAPGYAETKIRFSYELPVSHNFHKASEMLAKSVREKTNGEVIIELYPASQLAKDSSFVKAITSGNVDGGLSPTLYWTGIMPIAGIFDVPYVITRHDEAQKVLAGKAGQRLLNELNKFDLVGLGYYDFGFGIYGNNKRPLQTPADFKGLKIRANNDIGAKLLQTFGASPAFLSGSEVFIAVEHGTVDGTHTALTSVIERKIYDVMKYLTVDNHNFIPYFVVFRKAVYDKLTPEQQKILADSVREADEWVEQQQAKEDAEAVTFLRGKGMQVIELDAAGVKQWKDAAAPVREEWIKKVGKDGEDLLSAVEQDVGK